MKTNAAGVDLIKSYETLVVRPYLCPAGVWTIGYGHTGPDVNEHTPPITAHQAEAVLGVDLDKFERAVSSLTGDLGLTENQFSALVSLVFNIGTENFKGSTLLKRLRVRDFKGAAEQFVVWNKAKDPKTGQRRVLNGLVTRRAAEKALFLTPPKES